MASVIITTSDGKRFNGQTSDVPQHLHAVVFAAKKKKKIDWTPQRVFPSQRSELCLVV